ncbi:MAG: hypothetical protein ACO3FQ_02665 [Terrimicrobiaceae bacterium]
MKVSTVDQYRNFLKPDGAIDPALFSNQINNPNATGYDRMAQTWFDAIQAILATAKNNPDQKHLCWGRRHSAPKTWYRYGAPTRLFTTGAPAPCGAAVPLENPRQGWARHNRIGLP